jgi:hypothetical protein
MCKLNECQTVTSENGINYCVICDKNLTTGRRFGIMATLSGDETDSNAVDNLFFTKAEAEEYCHWLAENEVYPVSLCEVLENIYHI